MALLQRLFQNRRNAKQYNGAYSGQGETRNTGQCRLTLDKNKIRLLIITESEKGRMPYFDSNAIHRIEEKQLEPKKLFKTSCRLMPGSKQTRETPTENGGGVSNAGVKYQFQRIGSDVKMLEEMMFGNVDMAYKGATLKVHQIRFPPQLVVTKVFYPQKSKADCVSGDADSDSTQSSLSSSYADHLADFSTPARKVKSSSHVRSIPVDVPLVRENLVDSADEDSGLYSLTSSGSFQNLFPSPSNSSANSYNSLHRRWMRSQTTSLQRRWDSQETLNSVDSSQIGKRKKLKLAIGILFCTSDGINYSDETDSEEYRIFQSFFFAHMALIEGHVESLGNAVERAVFTGGNKVPAIFEALDQFRDAMYDLYMAPRLREPVWLSMMSNVSYRYTLCQRFIHEFVLLTSKYDNKSTKFFVSTLLSAVLTYHLAWVATVTPGDGTPSKTYLDKHSAKWIDTLAKTHPYNPLWAQLGDLYGAIGHPLRVARTVVVGRKADIVNKVLYMLSYFIRCSDVHEAPFSSCLPSILDSQCWEQTVPVSFASTEDCSTATECVGESNVSTISGDGTGFLHVGSSREVHRKESPSPRLRALERNCGACDSEKTVTLPVSSRVDGDSCDKERATGKCGLMHADKKGNCGACAGERTCSSEERTCLSQQGCVDCTEEETPKTCSGGREGTCGACGSTQGQPSHHNQALSRDSAERDLETRVLSDDSGIENSDSFDRKRSRLKSEGMGNPQGECRVSAVHIVEDSRLENIKHVQRCAAVGPSLSTEETEGPHQVSSLVDSKQEWNSKRPVSMLAQQLAADSEAVTVLEKQKAKMREVQKQFLSGGSNSMFEEYFEGDAETKTIDDISEHQIVVKHPLVSSGGVTPSQAMSSCRDTEESSGQVKSSVSRQSSVDMKPHLSRPTAFNPARCRSVTPTELERRRHLSSTSSVDQDVFDPLLHCQKIPMPGMKSCTEQPNVQAYEKNFGRTLLGGYSDHYMSDFVLHGTSDTSFRPKLLHDLQTTLQHSILDEQVAESVCIIADTDNWTVEVANSRLLEMSPSGTMPWTTSQLVANLIESVLDLHRLKMSAEFCIMHLEDRMQEMYFKSLMLAEYIKCMKSHNQHQLTAMLGFDASDLPLLLSIAGTHTPNLALGSESRVRSSHSS